VCEQAGVGSAEEAESAWVTRQEAERVVTQRDHIVKDDLRDLSPECAPQGMSTLDHQSVHRNSSPPA